MNMQEIKDKFKIIVDDYTNTMLIAKEENNIHLSFKMQWLYMDIKDLLGKVSIDEWNALDQDRKEFITNFMQEVLSKCPQTYASAQKKDSIYGLVGSKIKTKFNPKNVGPSDIGHTDNKRKIGFIRDETDYNL